MLRVNPLKRERLADPGFAGLLAEYGEVQAELARLEPLCSAELHSAVGTTEGQLRRHLLRIRRDIHNGRLPDAAGLDLPPAAAEWLLLATRARELEQTLAETQPGALESERARLAGLVEDEDFRRALALSAPEVLQAAVRYAEAWERGSLSKGDRKSERGLLQFVARSLVRTSPLSRFTAVGLAAVDRAGDGLGVVGADDATAFISLDLPLLNYVLGGVAGERTDPWIQQSPTVSEEADSGRVTFVHTKDRTTRRLSVPHTDSVHAVLRATTMGPRRFSTVVAEVEAQLGTGRTEAARLVAGTLSIGLLCQAPAGRECGGRLFGSALDEAPDGAGAELAVVKREADTLVSADAAERTASLERLRTAGLALSQRVGRPARLQVNEDFVLPPRRVSLAGHTRQLSDLANSVEFLSMFDRMHDVRALLSAAFVERYGRGGTVGLLDCAEYLVTKVYIREGVLDEVNAADLGPADGSLKTLHTVRRQALDELCADIDQRTGPHRDQAALHLPEVVWPSERLAELAAGAPARIRQGTLSYGVLVQSAGDRLVFNDAYAGHGMLYGRFLEADEQLGGAAGRRLAALLQAWYGNGARVVEDGGLHRLNVNRHLPVLPDRLGPEDWAQLRLVHDEETDSLHLATADGERVQVITLGAGMPERYPYPLRLANWLLSGGRLIRDVGAEWHRRHTVAGGPTTSSPRLVAGTTVISRRRWYPGDDAGELFEPGADTGDQLVGLARWRGRHGIPDQVLLKSELLPFGRYQAPAADTGEPLAPGRWRDKPQYVDCASVLFGRVMPRMLARRGAGWIEEALPGVEESAHAAEWVLGLARPDGGRFEHEEWL
ncbi:lantibiotic dehydratase [Kitasatospora sp. SUK 42]|uniref:lantibiotic dehydratase n=1 Tax=Kitasatospora sp. SUK 42 TaxID=1588882 RepID=UPI0018CA8BA9|nr:lantibiotic dehydratase [Kitasatospora sp. SUK 42]MBV2153690.1 lantibiotic dehydratase family protein [Kitasatospora sp. SUK 42]